MSSSEKTKISVRKASVNDAPGVAYVHMNTWLTTYRGLVTDDFLDNLNLEDFVNRTRGHLTQGANYYVVEIEGKVIGFAAGNRTRDENVKSKFDAEVYAIYVLKEHQKRGVGKILIQAMEESFTALGFRSMCIWVLRDNPSRKFYERLGGKFIMEKPINFGGKTLVEVAYGWNQNPSASN